MGLIMLPFDALASSDKKNGNPDEVYLLLNILNIFIKQLFSDPLSNISISRLSVFLRRGN